MNRSNSTIKKLRPIIKSPYNKEDFSSYYERVSGYFPNIPECVFKNWIYRHHDSIEKYSFLGFDKMNFRKVKWNTSKIYDEINSYPDNRIFDLGYQINEREDKSWLQKYMLNHPTWPAPIIVFQNDQCYNLGKPYHIMEGHLRLSYFREIYREEKDKLLEVHEIWLVTI